MVCNTSLHSYMVGNASLHTYMVCNASLHTYIIIIIILESAVQGRERVRTLSDQRPQPHTTNPWKEEKDKTVLETKKKEQIMPTGKHWLCS